MNAKLFKYRITVEYRGYINSNIAIDYYTSINKMCNKISKEYYKHSGFYISPNKIIKGDLMHNEFTDSLSQVQNAIIVEFIFDDDYSSYCTSIIYEKGVLFIAKGLMYDISDYINKGFTITVTKINN